MKTLMLTAVLGLALLATAGQAHEGEKHAAAPVAALGPAERAVAGALDGYAAAFSAKNLDKLKASFADPATMSFFEGSYVNRGWDSYRDHMAPEMQAMENPRYAVSNVRPFVQGDMAYATFDWSLDVVVLSEQFQGGRHPVAMKGVGTAVLGRAGGAWKIRHLHTATTPPPKKDKPAASH